MSSGGIHGEHRSAEGVVNSMDVDIRVVLWMFRGKGEKATEDLPSGLYTHTGETPLWGSGLFKVREPTSDAAADFKPEMGHE